MRSIYIRALSLLLCACMLITWLPPIEAEAAAEEDYYRDMVLEHYSESLNSDFFRGLTDEDGFLYKQWVDNNEKNSDVEKCIAWTSQVMLGKNLNQEAFVGYLCSLMGMLEHGFSDSVTAQASYTTKLSALDTAGCALDLVPFRADELKAACGQIGATAELLTNMVTDVQQLGVMATSATLYEQKITVLQIIRDNTTNAKLKEACEDVMRACDLEYVFILDNYADNILREISIIELDVLEVLWFKMVLPILSSPEMKTQLKFKSYGKVAQGITAAINGMATAVSYFRCGFYIGISIMKLIYSERSEYYREMCAMDLISDALITELRKLKKLSDSTGDPDARFEHIKDYETVAKALVFAHLRGEFCNVESRNTGDENQKLEKENYYSKIVTLLHKYEEDIAAIMAYEELYVVNDVFELHDGFIKKVIQKDQVPEGYIGIYDYEDLQKIIDHQPTRAGEFNEYVTSNYILMADIELPASYNSLSVFAGVFDGNGYCISNIQRPLFTSVANAEIKNLALDVNYVKDLEDEQQNYGALVRHTNGFTKDGKVISIGYNDGYSKIDNCYVTGYINLQLRSGDIGALAGNARYMEITNCYNKATIDVKSRQGCYVGGLTGVAGELSNCFNTAKISGFASAENTIHAWGVDVCVGGIGGYESNAQCCYNTGDISATAAYICCVRAGGIVGWAWIASEIGNCYNVGTVSSEANYPADNLDKILEDEKQYVESEFARFDAGGIVGFANCWGNDSENNAWIKNCWNGGIVKSRHNAGGIVGSGGGLDISDCCNTGQVSGTDCVGGIGGKLSEEISIRCCYNTGSVHGATMGSLVGDLNNAASVFENCYYLDGGIGATATGSSYTGAQKLTKAQTKQAESFEGFDFQKIWELKEDGKLDTPILRFRTLEVQEEQ